MGRDNFFYLFDDFMLYIQIFKNSFNYHIGLTKPLIICGQTDVWMLHVYLFCYDTINSADMYMEQSFIKKFVQREGQIRNVAM